MGADNTRVSPDTGAIHASQAPKPVGLYPHARWVGDLLFLSGVGPRDPETNQVPGLVLGPEGEIVSYDFEAQCHAVFRHVRTILEASGAAWHQLVDVTVFLTNMKADFATYNRIYAGYFQDVPEPPCRTTVEILSLPTPIAIEIKAIAAR